MAKVTMLLQDEDYLISEFIENNGFNFSHKGIKHTSVGALHVYNEEEQLPNIFKGKFVWNRRVDSYQS